MENESLNFIEQIVKEDLQNGKHKSILTRFPPEPNGYLHIGHAKSIVLNFGLAQEYGGKTNLRFDDTNPSAEKVEYVNSIKEDIKWLGYDWEEREFFASDYFDELYNYAIQLIKLGKAYVDNSTSEELAAQKGTVTEPGTESPYRNRSIEENLKLFEQMKNGEFEEGEAVLRAKIDMSHPNLNMRDPVIYRIKKMEHHRTGDAWNIYPMYDFAHGLSDALENVTHSLCTLEFENHRPLYEWILEALGTFPSRQIEFARLNLSYTIMSKRKLLRLVEQGYVNGWDDPRLPTISGMRRRGYTPTAIRNFAERVGIAKRDNVIDIALLEFFVREDLNKIATRRMVVVDPIKLIIDNFPEDHVEWMESENNPEDETAGYRTMPFSKELYIEREDFMEDPPKKYFRLAPGRFVRLKNGFIIEGKETVKDSEGNVIEVHCDYYPESRSGQDESGIKAKGVLHWVSVAHAKEIEVRQYDRLFNVESPDGDKDVDFLEHINPDSLNVVEKAYAEPALYEDKDINHYQFLRKGYFYKDPDSTADRLVFNRTVTLRDGWKKSKN